MNNEDILNITFECDDLGETLTIRQYLLKLLGTLWDEEESFSAKRPFGNSGWKRDIFYALADAGAIDAEPGDEWSISEEEESIANKIIADLIEEGL